MRGCFQVGKQHLAYLRESVRSAVAEQSSTQRGLHLIFKIH